MRVDTGTELGPPQPRATNPWKVSGVAFVVVVVAIVVLVDVVAIAFVDDA